MIIFLPILFAKMANISPIIPNSKITKMPKNTRSFLSEGSLLKSVIFKRGYVASIIMFIAQKTTCM